MKGTEMKLSEKIERVLSDEDYVHVDKGYVRSLLPDIRKLEQIEMAATAFIHSKNYWDDESLRSYLEASINV